MGSAPILRRRPIGHSGVCVNRIGREVPVLEALCRAVLEYVYTTPLLLKTVEDRLGKIKKEGSKKA